MWTRLATDSDLADILRIDAIAEVETHRRALISQAIAHDACWMGGCGDSSVGYLALSRRRFFGRDFVELVVVQARARRRGVASALFQAAEAGATTRQLFTSTNQSNLLMQALLERRAYKKAGVISHLDPDDPEVVFVKYLR